MDRDKLLEIIRNLASTKILVVGDYMLDIYTYGDAARISPEAPVPILKVTETEYRCGGAGSVATDIATLGATPICIGVTGDDREGQILRDKIAETGSDMSGLIRAPQRNTISKRRLVGLAQQRHRQQLIRIDQETIEPFEQAIYDKIIEIYISKLNSCDIVCLQDYNKGLLTDEITRKMIELAIKIGKKVLVDPSLRSDYSKYSQATLITPNRKETSIAVGFEINDISDVSRAATLLFKALNLEAVVITLDKQGAFLKTGDFENDIPTRPRSVYDVTGAGDMVLAMLAVALSNNCDYETAVQLSNIAGGIEVEKFGAVAVTVQEIEDELICQDGGRKSKVHSVESLVLEIESRKRKNQKIVFTNGCFDVIHRGHVEYLAFCKSKGDILVVGLNSDSSVKQIKGQGRPINNEQDRAIVLSALEPIDYIVIFEEPTPIELIKKVKPDVLVKGQDWEDKGIVGREFVESYGGIVVLAPLAKDKSTSNTIEKIKSL
jgi:D-beta-D-heptose 7-phosphate kinase/D-beta-D-heptose 1-phosphate adenosyltransferase